MVQSAEDRQRKNAADRLDAAEFPALCWACPHADAISSARSSESQLGASGGRSPAERS